MSCAHRSCSAAGPSSEPRRRVPRPRWDKPSSLPGSEPRPAGTYGAARAEPSLLELCRVATDEDEVKSWKFSQFGSLESRLNGFTIFLLWTHCFFFVNGLDISNLFSFSCMILFVLSYNGQCQREVGNCPNERDFIGGFVRFVLRDCPCSGSWWR